MSHDPNSLPTRAATAYANLMVQRPLAVLLTIAVLSAGATYAASKLTINSNQLDLISQDLPEIKAVNRLIDMVGGVGFLVLGLKGDNADVLKKVSDDLAMKLRADTEDVRNVTYRIPVEFMQERMVLFVKTEDLSELKSRWDKFIKQKMKEANPFYIKLRDTPPATIEYQDIVDKYTRVGKKSIVDDYYISPDRQMMILLIKPMWDGNHLGKTKAFIDKINAMLVEYSANNPYGVKLVENYDSVGSGGVINYGYTGSYKTNVDDSYAIEESLGPVTVVAFVSIFLITLLFFRKIVPSFLVIFGTVLGTILTMGFVYVSVGQLNMITSILGGILMGFGVDYGIHFTFRTRIELGAGKPYDVAIRDALVNAGRPAFIAAIVTGGSFMVLMVSEFRGFSQFGFLAGCGTLILGFTLFSVCPAVLSLIGKYRPTWVEKAIGHMEPPKAVGSAGEIRIPRPKLMLAICCAVVAVVCAFAVPWSPTVLPKDRPPTLLERLRNGVRFDYDARAFAPAHQSSVVMQDEINERYQISSDPVGIYTKTLEEAKAVFDELSGDQKTYPSVDRTKFPSVDAVASIYSFVPPRETAEANAKILAQWKEEFSQLDTSLFPPEMQEKLPLINKILDAKPYGIEDVPDIYASQFRHQPTAKPENQGWLTFVYPSVDLRDSKMLTKFADETAVIKTADGKEYRSAGLAQLYAKLSRIVLWDGKLTVILATLWILLMHYLDFRSVTLAAASVIPLGVGLLMMLGLLSLTNHNLNFMNVVILPILLGFGVSHGLYLLHRFLEGTSPVVALRSVGAAVASSTLTAIAGFGSLFVASHNGLKSMGFVACLGLTTTLIVSFTVLAAVLELIYDKRKQAKIADQAGIKQSA
jgi:predicted RND superfamily exporter protein